VSDVAGIEATSGGLGRPSRRRVRLLHNDLFLPIGVGIVLIFVAFALFPGFLAPHDPIKLDITNQNLSPRPGHWLGTDQFGRDILSRIIYGTRTSLGMAFAVVVFGAAIGTLVGAVAGFLGGWVDEVLMRIVDVFLSLPSFILAMALAAALGRGVTSLTTALVIIWWPGYARLIRGMVMSIGERLHVESARALGVSRTQIVRRHILPFTYTQLNVRITQDVGYALVAVASLSFIGLGAQPPSSEWGLMLSDARQYILQAWWYPLFPGLAIMLLTVGLAMIGDAIADRHGAGDDVLDT
jgi:peptide/nickel transport system permease protein